MFFTKSDRTNMLQLAYDFLFGKHFWTCGTCYLGFTSTFARCFPVKIYNIATLKNRLYMSLLSFINNVQSFSAYRPTTGK